MRILLSTAATVALAVGMAAPAGAAFQNADNVTIDVFNGNALPDPGRLADAGPRGSEIDPVVLFDQTGTDTGRLTPFSDLGRNTLAGYENAAYHVVGQSDNPAAVELDLSGTTLPLIWGSPDSNRNLIEFFAGNTAVGSVSGRDILDSDLFDTGANPTAGNGVGYANVLLSITDGTAFDRIVLSNNEIGPAFEYSLSQVPLPAAAWLMIGGLGAVYGAARRRRAAAAAA